MSTCPRELSTTMLIGQDETLNDETYDLEDEQSGRSPKRPGLPLEPRRVVRILSRERKVLLRTFLGVAGVALLASFFVPETYRSGGQLLYEGTPLLDEELSRSDPRPFVDSAMSSSQLRKVREKLGWGVSLAGLRGRLEIGIEDKTSVRIAATGGTPDDAQMLAEAVFDVFLERQVAYNANRLEKLRIETERSIERATKRRAEAVARVEAFRDQSGKTNLIDDQNRLLERIAKLRASADAAAVEVAAQEARITELEKARQELPKQIVASATVGKSVDEPLAKAKAELATARATLSGEHPRVQALQERVRSLERQRQGQRVERADQTMVSNPARTAVEQDLATTRAALAGAQEREAALRVLIDAVKAEAEALAPAEGEARKVANELKVAEARFEELTNRATRIRDAAVSPITGFRVLSAPSVPEEATRSAKTLMILALIPVLVTLILAIVLLVRSLRTLALESPRELAWWGRGPVLGTSTWPRIPEALETFVDELEDYGVHGAGRTLVVPASEAERDIACAFAMRLSEAPWLAAAVLDVEEPGRPGPGAPLVTPPASVHAPRISSPDQPQARRLSSPRVSDPASTSGKPVTRRPPARPTIQGFAPPDPDAEPPVEEHPESTSKTDASAGSKWSSAPPPTTSTPLPPKVGSRPSSSRPPRKPTIMGLPAVKGGHAVPTSAGAAPEGRPRPRAVRGVARATVRMVVQPSAANDSSKGAATDLSEAASPPQVGEDAQAFLLTRPVAAKPSSDHPTEPTQAGPQDAPASEAVMRAAMRLLGDSDDDTQALRRSQPPSTSTQSTTAVALAWNGPLGGPVLRRAARLAHRVLVVVSSGMNVIELTRVTKRLGRSDGVGYVLVNLAAEYVDQEDRVGEVEAFWTRPSGVDAPSSGAR
ncbi:MAG: hypothetical protein AAF500_02175 [Myxococcota bacterium]